MSRIGNLLKDLLGTARYKISHLLSVDEYAVLDARHDSRGVLRLFMGGKEIEAGEWRLLKAEAAMLMETHLWRIMQETVKGKAVELALKNSTKWDEVLAGKMMLHNLGLLKSIVETLEKSTPPST